MNRSICKTTVRFTGAVALVVVAAIANAQTFDLVVDGKANCFDLTPGGNGGNVAAQLELPAGPGTYTVKVKSSTTAFCSEGRCLQPDVALNLWGGSVSYYEPFLVKPGVKGLAKPTLVVGNGGTVYAYVMDNPCGDNSGKTVLAITKTQ